MLQVLHEQRLRELPQQLPRWLPQQQLLLQLLWEQLQLRLSLPELRHRLLLPLQRPLMHGLHWPACGAWAGCGPPPDTPQAPARPVLEWLSGLPTHVMLKLIMINDIALTWSAEAAPCHA